MSDEENTLLSPGPEPLPAGRPRCTGHRGRPGHRARGFALALAQAGAAVAVVDLAAERAESVAEEIRSVGGRAISIAADVTVDEDIVGFVGITVAEFGKLDIAVNNAGVNRNAAAEDTTLDDWDLHQKVEPAGGVSQLPAAGGADVQERLRQDHQHHQHRVDVGVDRSAPAEAGL